MDFGINGKIALVTASTRGLGRGCAEQLAAEQCRVAICSRDADAAKKAAEEISSQTGAEVAVVTIATLEGEPIENYAVELFEQWGIGKEGEDNGVLFIAAIEDKKMRIEVGYGLEGTLTDAETKLILENTLL